MRNNSNSVFHKFCNRINNSRTDSVNWKGSNVYCEDNNIYSYGEHYCLGFFAFYKDIKILFINNNGYSNSTAKHIYKLRQAVNSNIQDIVIEYEFGVNLKTNGFNSESFNKLKHKKEFFQKILNNKRTELNKEYEAFFKSRLLRCNDVSYLNHYGDFKTKERVLINQFSKLNLKYIPIEFNEDRIKKHCEYRAEKNKINEEQYEIKRNEREQKEKIANLKNTITHNLEFKYKSPFNKLEIINNQIHCNNGEIAIDEFKKWFKLWYSKITLREAFKKDNVRVGDYMGIAIKKTGIVRVGCTRFFPDEIMKCGKQLNLVGV